MRALLALLAACPLRSPVSVAAQQPALPASGARVRIALADSGEVAHAAGISAIPGVPGSGVPTPRGRFLVARLLAATPDSLILIPDRRSDTLRTRVSCLTRLEVSRGLHAAIGRGIAIGALAGAAVGGLVGALTTKCDPEPFSFCDVDRFANALLGAGIGVVAGGVVGGGIGSARRIDPWRLVPLPRHLSRAPGERWVTLARTASF